MRLLIALLCLLGTSIAASAQTPTPLSAAIAKLQGDQATLSNDLAGFGGATVTVGTVTPAYQKLVQDAAVVSADAAAIAALPTTAPVVSTSPDGTTIIPGKGTIVDATGATWSLASSGQVIRNGSPIAGATAANLSFINLVEITASSGAVSAWDATSGTFQPCQ